MSDKIKIDIDADLEDLIPDYLNNRKSDLEKIARWIEEDNFGEIERLGHQLKGSGSGYGFDFISELGKKLEEGGREGNKEMASQLRQELEHYLNNIEITFVEED